MQRASLPLPFATAVLLAAALLGLAGCPYTADPGLPAHIQTVRVPTFTVKKDVFYYGLEGALTRKVIERLVRDPRVSVVNENEDALLTGEIVKVNKQVLRETKTDHPSLIQLSVTVKISFEDKVEGAYLIENLLVSSSASSSGAGVYDLERGQDRSLAEGKAMDELADSITRRVVSVW